MNRKEIHPKSGAGFELKRGQKLKVISPEGEQVSDLFCFSQENPGDALSSGRSIDYEDTLLFRKGNKLIAQSGRTMLEIIEDTCGRHDFLVTPCSCQMFQMINGDQKYYPSCLENLELALRKFPVRVEQIGTSFNIFMNVDFKLDGKVKVEAPISKPGDYVVLLAHMDLYVGLTACSDEGSNNGSCKRIEFEII